MFFLVFISLFASHGEAQVMTDLYHQCSGSSTCEFEFSVRGTYEFSKISAQVVRLETDRFPDSTLDITNIIGLKDIFINSENGLPQEICAIVTGTRQTCVNIHVTRQPIMQCCLTEKTMKDSTQVNNGVKVGEIDDRHIDEASGLCASRVHPGILYTHNDHGGDNKLYAIDSRTASVISVITVNGATNKDWEDIACGKCYGHLDDFCIYIGDIGDDGNALTVYRVVEPAILTDKVFVSAESALKFSWNEPDAETLMVTPDAELYVISKEDHADAVIGLIPSSGWGTGSRVPITRTGHLNGVRTSHKDPRGGDISPDGNEILIKTDDNILHYSMNGGKDYISVLGGSPVPLPYISEKQGESVAFDVDGQSYFTLGEGSHKPLYRYDAIF